MDCSLSGSSVPGILQARILEWAVIPFSRGSSWSRNWTQIFCIAGRFFTDWATRETKNTGVDSLFLLQGIFLIQESNWGHLHCRRILYQLSYQGIPCALLVRSKLVQPLWKTLWRVSPKLKTEVSSSSETSEGNTNSNSKRRLYPHVHYNTIYNSQDEKEPKYLSKNEWIKKTWYICKRVWFSHKKERNPAICDNMDRPWRH